MMIRWSPPAATITFTHGYQIYLLWLMAGDHQGFNRSSDLEHAWIERRKNFAE